MDYELESLGTAEAGAAEGRAASEDLSAEALAKGFIAVGITITAGLAIGALIGKRAEPHPPKPRVLGPDKAPTLRPDQAIQDRDHDGLYDSIDPNPRNPDVDGDGIPDGRDLDWHNPDLNGNGIVDGKDPAFLLADRDHDGLPDVFDAHPDDPDFDHDGILDGHPLLRPHELGARRGFYTPPSPSSYIVPKDEVVQGFAKGMEVRDLNSAIRLGDVTVEGAKLLRFADGRPLAGRYFFDGDQFGHTEYWQNPDHYLTRLGRGDCEDYALASNALLEAKGHESVVVLGSAFGGGHAWTETLIDGKVYLTDNNVRDLLLPRDVAYRVLGYQPQSMFSDDIPLGAYNRDWSEWK